MNDVTIVYVRADSVGRILQCEGGVSERNIKNPAEWVELDRGAGARYEFCQEYYFDRSIYTDDGIPRYKLVDGQAVERTQEEIETDRATIHIERVHRPSQDDISRLMIMMAQDVPGEVALSVQSMYNVWEAGKRYGYDGCEKIVKVPNLSPNLGDPYLLYRCNQPHTSQADWQPQITPALWTRINKSNAGTIEDPIPAAASMEYEYGLYYLDPDDGNIYLCERIGEASGGKITLHYLPHELVGQYFTLVSLNGE